MTELLTAIGVEPGDRVLLVHAHPDDETLSTGGLIAALTENGVACDLVTCTRGECGEIIAGVLPPDAGVDDLVAHRLGELAAASATLGVERHAFLGTPPARVTGLAPRRYRDSGMQWVTPTLAGPGPDAGPDSLTSASIDEAADDLAAAISAWQPTVVVSYDLGGGYGHPDHVRTAEVALTASALTGVPLVQVVTGEPTDATWVDVGDQVATARAALRHYASQLTVHQDHVVHVGGQRQAIVTSVGLRRI